MMRYALILCCSTILVAQVAISFPTDQNDGAAGAPLWLQWVTAGQRLTLWDNEAQTAQESKHPPSDPEHRHPSASQTRWSLDGLVSGGPDGWRFAMLEIGGGARNFFCAPDACEYTLFGLETVNGKDVRLHSYVTYGNQAARDAISALHDNHKVSTPIIKFSDMVEDSVKLVYKYGYNSTAGATVFFGQGGGSLPASIGGGRIEVQETVAQDYVAPLELFYDASGRCNTPYDTPLVYRRLSSMTPDLSAAASSNTTAWPSSTAQERAKQCCFCSNGGEGSGACTTTSFCNTKGGGYKCSKSPEGCQWYPSSPLNPKGGCA